MINISRIAANMQRLTFRQQTQTRVSKTQRNTAADATFPPLFPLSEVAQGSPQLMLRSGRIVISSSSSLERALNPGGGGGGGARRPHPSPSPSSSRPFPLSLRFSSRRLTTPRRLRQRRTSRHAATTTAVPPSTLPMISLSRVEMSSA